MPTYIPSKGDYIAVTFDPQSRISRAAPAVLDAVLSLLDACIY